MILFHLPSTSVYEICIGTEINRNILTPYVHCTINKEQPSVKVRLLPVTTVQRAFKCKRFTGWMCEESFQRIMVSP